MMTIHKYPIGPSAGISSINLPEGAKLLHYEEGYLWALVDTEAAMVGTSVAVIGTGWEVPAGGKYVGTKVERTGYVWHLFRFAFIVASLSLAAACVGAEPYAIERCTFEVGDTITSSELLACPSPNWFDTTTTVRRDTL